ncbi:acid protease, partial [Patellaria atrata CBS 101060]
MATIPTPYIFPVSEKFEGNDGHWSTFVVDAGTSGQQFHVLPSLSSAGLWLPIPDGCNRTDAPDDCPELRGAQSFGNRRNEGYNTSLSNSYTVIGIFKLVFPSIETETHYGEPWSNSSGLYATDTVSLHSGYNSSIQLDDSLVVSIKTVNYFMGLFGLAHGGVKLFSHTYQSLLSTLNSSSAESPRIPSMSYGYTAGAYYRNNTFGSLVLGGYDRSRRLDSDAPDSEISMPLDANDSEALKVLVSDMTVRTGGGNAQSVMGGVYQNFEVNIDSTLPYLWLPPAVCDKLSDALGLKFDNETGLYTLSNQQRQNNLDGITIGIRLTRADEQDQALQVDLPYAAFDQDVSWPFYNEAKHYFPIKRAEGSMAYTFGRTFLQEAYVTVDYDQKNWSLSRVNWTESRPEPQVVPIINPSFETSSGGRGLSTGAIVGIVFGVLAVLLLAAGWFFFKRRRQNRKKL